MIDNSKIVTSFRNLIAYEQTNDSQIPQLDTSLLSTSETQQTVQKLHPILSLLNIYMCWDKNGAFSDFLNGLRDASIKKLISALYTQKNINQINKQLLSETSMWEGSGNFHDLIIGQGRFVGLKIYSTEKDVSLIINRIGIQISAANATLPIYIYHSSQSDPLYSLTINQNKVNSFSWYTVPQMVLPYIEGGYYVLGYYEDDITGQAINRRDNLMLPPCSCDPVNNSLWQKWSKFTKFEPIFIQNGHIKNDKTKWEESDQNYTNNTNFGINVTISAVCDITDLICRNKFLFVEALGKQITKDLIEVLKFNTSDNSIKEMLASDTMAALYGDGNGKVGVEYDYREAMKALSFEISDLNPVCLPCDNNQFRIRQSTVYR